MRRVLLDESLPRQLVGVLADLEVVTVLEAGWAGKTNGELLELAQENLGVLLTGDRNIRFQQNVAKYSIGVVVAAGRSTKLEDILPLVPALREAINTSRPARSRMSESSETLRFDRSVGEARQITGPQAARALVRSRATHSRATRLRRVRQWPGR